MTRILSVFNQLKRVGFAVLLLGTAYGQSQAPIEWEVPNLLSIESDTVEISQLLPMGDTLIFSGYGSAHHVYVAFSHDNGQTSSSWERMILGSDGFDWIHLGGSGGYVLAGLVDYQNQNPALPAIRLSQDGGNSWGALQHPRSGGAIRCFMSDSISLRLQMSTPTENGYAIRAYRSVNRAATWLPGQIIEDSDSLTVPFNCIAKTNNAFIVLGWVNRISSDRIMRYSIGENEGEVWSVFHGFPGQPYEDSNVLYSFCITADTVNGTANVLSYWYDIDHPMSPMKPWLTRTLTHGLEWEDPVPLQEEGTIQTFADAIIFSSGKFTSLAWPDVRNGDVRIYSKFSANHGATWYPDQYVVLAENGILNIWGECREHMIYLYWSELGSDSSGRNVYSARGVFLPDSVRPVVSPVVLPPDTVEIGDTLQFIVDVEENDTLSRVSIVISRSGAETIILDMVHQDDGNWYRESRVVEPGYYEYWFEAEDFWENSSTFPPEHRLTFVTEGWSSTLNYEVLNSLEVSVFPNPCNTWPSIILSPGWLRQGPLNVEVFNVLGQRLVNFGLDGTQDIINLNGHVSGNSGSTGIYWLIVSNRSNHSSVKKFLYIR